MVIPPFSPLTAAVGAAALRAAGELTAHVADSFISILRDGNDLITRSGSDSADGLANENSNGVSRGILDSLDALHQATRNILQRLNDAVESKLAGWNENSSGSETLDSFKPVEWETTPQGKLQASAKHPQASQINELIAHDPEVAALRRQAEGLIKAIH